MALEQPDKEAYKARVEADTKAAAEKLEADIGMADNIDKAIQAAKDTIAKSRDGVINSMSARQGKGEIGKGLDESIDVATFRKTILDMADKAIKEISDHEKNYKDRHEAIRGVAQISVDMEKPKNKKEIDNLNKMTSEFMRQPMEFYKRGAATEGAAGTQDIAAWSGNLQKLQQLSDKGVAMNTTFLEPRAADLRRFVDSMKTLDPPIAERANELLATVLIAQASCKQAKILYTKWLDQIQRELPQKLTDAKTREKELMLASAKKQGEKGNGNVSDKELADAYTAYMNQKKIVEALSGYNKDVGGMSPSRLPAEPTKISLPEVVLKKRDAESETGAREAPMV